jgi:2-polyprenyl-6-methoxyphenol hydroxylase-like FAD-dependent oxidoreductase
MKDAIIVGGGIGGLTTAIALQRLGVDAHVYETAPVLQAVGAGIWLPPNAMQVLAHLGLAQRVVGAGVPLSRIEVRDVSGGVLQALDGARLEAEFGYRAVSIRRSELQRVLASSLKRGSLHLGKRLSTFTESRVGAGVQAHFSDGSMDSGSVLIAADGIRSTVRRQLYLKDELRYSGQTCFRGLAPLRLPEPLRTTAWEVWGGVARFGFSAVSAEHVYWYAPVTAPEGTVFATEELKEYLLWQYEGFPDVVSHLVKATGRSGILQTDLYDFRPISKWHFGRIVLLGDAAHASTPNLGQGGAQAIEDALSLARKVEAEGLTPPALEQFEQSRMARTRRIVNLSWQFGKLAHLENPLLRGLRNISMRWMPQRLQWRQVEALLSPEVA